MDTNHPGALWVPVFIQWQDFVTQNPQLGLADSLAGMRRFLALHAESLVQHGTLAKVNGRHWLANNEKFNEAAFLAAIGHLESLQRACRL